MHGIITTKSGTRAARLRALLLPALALTSVACASGGRYENAGERPILFGLPGVIDSVVNTPPLDRTHWGIAAYDTDADRMLARVNYEKHFIPASNMKLVTTAVGLALLGPDYRYTTEVRSLGGSAAEPEALVLAGQGDPSMSYRFHDSELSALRMLVDSIAAAGVTHVRGPLIIDTRYFDDLRVNPSWEVGDLDWNYAAPVAAFAVDEATLAVVVRPGSAPGEPARATALVPDGVVVIDNQLVTDTAYARYEWGFLRETDEVAFRFEGTVPVTTPADTIRIPVRDPAAFAGAALAALLRERGIAIDGGVRVLRMGDDDIVNAQPARPIATWRSAPLADIAGEILKPSNNWIAEQLLKTIGAAHGAEGSWEAGLAVERDFLVDVVGIDSTAFQLRDGSGLSAQNLLSPEAILELLRFARQQSWGDEYRAALAEPGGAEGTLERRLAGLEGRAFAKTGTITNVNALSGYVVNELGNEVVFSILTNGTGEPASQVRPAMDRVLEAIAATGAAPPPPVAQPSPMGPY